MKIKKIVLPVLTVAIIASCLGACACSSQNELHKMIEKGEQIELEVATLDHEEKGTDTEIIWTELAKLTTYANFRTAFENTMGIQTNGGLKTGVVYVDLEGNQTNNSTLYNAFMNSQFISKWSDETVQSQLRDGISTTYADLEESDYTAAIINAYFNLIDDNQPNYFNGGASLSRAEAMTILMRAVTPVEDLKANDTFKSLVGESEYTAYASYMDSNAFISSSDKSISEKNFNGAMTRAEFVYMVMNQTFGKETVSNYDVSKVSLNDCKDAGNIAATEKFSGKDYCNSYVLTQMVKNPEAGATTEIYKALAMAKDLGIISAETRWDEAITKTEGIEIIANTFQAYVNLNGSKTELESGNLLGETYREQAGDKYESIKDELSCDKESYVNEYIELVDSGKSSEEVEKILYEKYEDTEKNGSGAEVETPTAAPNETQSETIEIVVNDEMKEVAFDDNWSEWIQLQNGVFIYKQATGVLYYWGSDIDAVDWENPIVANRLVPTDQLVTISTGTETISSISSTDNSNNNNNNNNNGNSSNTDSSSPQREELPGEIDPSDDTAEEWGGIVFNP